MAAAYVAFTHQPFPFFVWLPSHLCVHATDLKPSFDQAEPGSDERLAVPMAVAVVVAVARRGGRAVRSCPEPLPGQVFPLPFSPAHPVLVQVQGSGTGSRQQGREPFTGCIPMVLFCIV